MQGDGTVAPTMSEGEHFAPNDPEEDSGDAAQLPEEYRYRTIMDMYPDDVLDFPTRGIAYKDALGRLMLSPRYEFSSSNENITPFVDRDVEPAGGRIVVMRVLVSDEKNKTDLDGFIVDIRAVDPKAIRKTPKTATHMKKVLGIIFDGQDGEVHYQSDQYEQTVGAANRLRKVLDGTYYGDTETEDSNDLV